MMSGQIQKSTLDKKCPSDMAERYVNDLFELLEIKGQNSQMFNQFCSLLMKYKISVVKESWRSIVYMCELPNGQIAGKLPPLWKVENTFQQHNLNKFNNQHKLDKSAPVDAGVVMKLWDIGKQYASGEIGEDELDKLVELLKKEN